MVCRLERNQSNRSFTSSLEGGFSLRKKPLSCVSSGVDLLWFRYTLAIPRQPAFNFQFVKAKEENAAWSGAGRCALAPKAALALTGFSAVVGQIVLMRELIVVFNGNEISLGIMLATWLFWTAAGSSVCSILGLGTRDPRRSTAALECLLAVSLPATIWALRAAKSIFETVRANWWGQCRCCCTTLRVPELVLRGVWGTVCGCGADDRTRVRSYGARDRQFGLFAGGRGRRSWRDCGQPGAAALS